MKNHVAILSCAILICGCNQKMPDKWDSATIEWNQKLQPKQILDITTENGSKFVEVSSPDAALDVLGKYGWELVAVTQEEEGDNGIINEVYHLKRHHQATGDFWMYPNPK